MNAERITTAADLLLQARWRSGMTQAQLADRACVARTVVCEVERGRRQPALVTLQRLVAGAGYCVELRLFRPDRLGAQLSGPIGERVIRDRAGILEAVAEKGLGRVWVTGVVARGEEVWDSRLELVVEGIETLQWDERAALTGRIMSYVGLVTTELLPTDCGHPDDVLLADEPEGSGPDGSERV